mmetsp:Transcript_12288/g.26413  ORF Transcript_12288/g.26413 Transcript_12288/m.26413 type:complete len:262 (-) Transcript_12288:90-875(-)|eukprot:CAMPEP_0204330102 /NCGR_PEP_ID=MMETSP0469-20131031/14663_1 /ASSEMBLY_ACC=CAM_ASM_000384 /TAXON_ID=2969 /ORGANISM="Oxyrrhis marina" /LENGTH=261 /DNA_ID=CAMNT_0051312827 /DNA_START=33 /DNA_END=818 /DNA_ORIENTATION=+
MAQRAAALAAQVCAAPAYISFAGRRCIVTGAARGIARVVAKNLHSLGASIVAVDILDDQLASLKGEIDCETVKVDLSDAAALTKAIEGIVAKGAVHHIVNAAGIAIFEPFFDQSIDNFDKIYAINVRAIEIITRVVTKDLAKQKAVGSIVNFSSQSSYFALPDHLAYSSSKAAVDHITRIQAFELGPYGIRVNAVNPTVVMTELAKKAWSEEGVAKMKESIPLRKLATEQDVADAVVWLLSDKASMVTGVTLPVDGGRTVC